MRRPSRALAACLIVACASALLPETAPAQARPTPGATGLRHVQQGNADTKAEGVVEGERLAGSVRTGGKMGLGVAAGAFTGPLGAAIGYLTIGPEQMRPEDVRRNSARSAAYQAGFEAGWERKSQSRKRKAFLLGALLGAAASVGVAVAVVSSSKGL